MPGGETLAILGESGSIKSVSAQAVMGILDTPPAVITGGHGQHVAATPLLQQGVPARVVMEILGHSQISLTLGTYSHIVPELAPEAAERMGDALWS